MINSPRYVIFVAVSRYLTDEQINLLKEELGKENPKQDRKFLSILKKHFDFEKMKTKPYIWQDIWVYNYLEYECPAKFKRKGLIAKYEREIVLPTEKVYKEYLDLLK